MPALAGRERGLLSVTAGCGADRVSLGWGTGRRARGEPAEFAPASKVWWVRNELERPGFAFPVLGTRNDQLLSLSPHVYDRRDGALGRRFLYRS